MGVLVLEVDDVEKSHVKVDYSDKVQDVFIHSTLTEPQGFTTSSISLVSSQLMTEVALQAFRAANTFIH